MYVEVGGSGGVVMAPKVFTSKSHTTVEGAERFNGPAPEEER